MFSSNTSQVADDKLFVEDCFSTYLYQGNGSTQTITNGIDLAGKGGMVWMKARSSAQSHIVFDTNRGVQNRLSTNFTSAQTTTSDSLTAFNSNGFNIDAFASINTSGTTYASWTFRKAPKFFDVVTYTGDGVAGRTISHSLGVEPGFIIVKATSTNHGWACFHRGNGTNQYALRLNSTGAGYTPATAISGFPVSATSTTFTVRSGVNNWDAVDYSANDTGQTYVAYLFAHDTTSDGIIQCGSYTGNNTVGNTVTLGWEPQWVLIKNTTNAQFWGIYDNMRGMPVGSNDALLLPNSSGAEQSYEAIQPTATGFQLMNTNQDTNASGNTYIYIAIRRGPMRTPTSGTSVFSPASPTGSSLPTQIPTGFPVDLGIIRNRTFVDSPYFFDRLRGTTTSSINYIRSDSTAAEAAGSGFGMGLDNNTGVTSNWYSSADPTISWNFRRAPSFFDEVCYTGTGSARTINHNLGVAPELMIVKRRSGVGNWPTYASSLGNANSVFLNLTDASAGTAYWNSTSPTSSVFSVGATASDVNANGNTYVAYLFASCPGVSKVGSYTGNGSSQTINCGFAAGARFVMIKRTDSTGNWLVADSARGIVAGNDPLLYLNSTAAEVTSLDWIDADSSGFVVNQDSTANANVSGGTYLFFAVA